MENIRTKSPYFRLERVEMKRIVAGVLFPRAELRMMMLRRYFEMVVEFDGRVCAFLLGGGCGCGC